MSILKSALVQMEKGSKKEFERCYKAIVELFLEDSDLDASLFDIDELIAELGSAETEIEYKKINGISVTYKNEEKKIYPHASYGWDHGSAIDTKEFNLKELETNDFGGGPIATIVELKNQKLPGIVLHYSSSDEFGEIQIFG